MLGVQLWLNLPAKDKMVKPQYHDITADMVPIVKEDGNEIQLKCVLTCAKVNVEPNGENAIPGENVSNEINFSQIQDATPTNIEPTQEEKDNIEHLMKVLGL